MVKETFASSHLGLARKVGAMPCKFLHILRPLVWSSCRADFIVLVYAFGAVE